MNDWHFDPISAVIGAVLALSAAWAAYRQRKRFARLRDQIRQSVRRLIGKVTASLEERYKNRFVRWAGKQGTIWNTTGLDPSGGNAAGAGIGRLHTVAGLVAGAAGTCARAGALDTALRMAARPRMRNVRLFMRTVRNALFYRTFWTLDEVTVQAAGRGSAGSEAQDPAYVRRAGPVLWTRL